RHLAALEPAHRNAELRLAHVERRDAELTFRAGQQARLWRRGIGQGQGHRFLGLRHVALQKLPFPPAPAWRPPRRRPRSRRSFPSRGDAAWPPARPTPATHLEGPAAGGTTDGRLLIFRAMVATSLIRPRGRP